jgi:hypothetical protein
VAQSNCRSQILAQKPNDPFLVGVGHGHAVSPRDSSLLRSASTLPQRPLASTLSSEQ